MLPAQPEPAVRDFLQVAARRWDGGDIVVVPAKVQGKGAAQEVADAIDKACRLDPKPEVIVVTRGGGSVEDLWSFNEQVLVRKVAECPIPTISGVGHEIDLTLCDLAADVRALTPSEAAERVFPDKSTTLTNLQNTRLRLVSLLENKVASLKSRLDILSASTVFTRPLEFIHQHQQVLDEYSGTMSRAMDRSIETRKNSISQMAAKLHALSPLNVLSRGYSLTQNENGELLKDSATVSEGQTIVSRLNAGRVESIVSKVHNTELED